MGAYEQQPRACEGQRDSHAAFVPQPTPDETSGDATGRGTVDEVVARSGDKLWTESAKVSEREGRQDLKTTHDGEIDPHQTLLLDQHVGTSCTVDTFVVLSTPRATSRPRRGRVGPVRRLIALFAAATVFLLLLFSLPASAKPVLKDARPPLAIERPDLALQDPRSRRTCEGRKDNAINVMTLENEGTGIGTYIPDRRRR